MRRGGGAAASAADDDDDDFYSGGGEQQRLLEREQDDTLADLASSVERVHGLAVTVNEELGSQNRLLDSIDEDVSRTDSRLRGMHATLRKLSKDSDCGKYCLIVVLLCVLVWLLMLVLS